MRFLRGSGLLLHISSLPGRFGIGTMGAEARNFVDFLKSCRQQYWQILPLGPVSNLFGYSPYSSLSTFAGNELLIDPQKILDEIWMKGETLPDLSGHAQTHSVNFEPVEKEMRLFLDRAAGLFFGHADAQNRDKFDRFCQDQKSWLDDYSLFASLSKHFGTNHWLQWDEAIRMRRPQAMAKWQATLAEEIKREKFSQYIFFHQWRQLMDYCRSNGVKVIGDIPIYVNLDGADVWSHPEVFQLDEVSGLPEKVAGVPPDYFSSTGQRWGNPLYRWYTDGQLNADVINWWLDRIGHLLNMVDILRIDHFRGFESYWAIPAQAENAVSGSWLPGPGSALFEKIQENIGGLPVIAEDLGIITGEVEELRDRFGIAGIKVLQFAFDHKPDNPYLPNNFSDPNCVVYTGTHDNNTSNGWFYGSEIDAAQRDYVCQYLNKTEPHDFHWDFIQLALSSPADIALIPVQDLLGYGREHRMNTPGSSRNNWRWKMTGECLTDPILERLKTLTILYNRVQSPVS